MIIHTNVLTRRDLYAAIVTAGLHAEGTWLEDCEQKGSRKTDRAFKVALEHDGSLHKRYRNPGTSGRVYADWDGDGEKRYAASWEQWGRWMLELFAIDPEAIVGEYVGVEDFHRVTKDTFRVKETA